jgi:hypothetical protein
MRKRINIKDAGLYDPQASSRDADVIIKNSELVKLRASITSLEAKLAIAMDILQRISNTIPDGIDPDNYRKTLGRAKYWVNEALSKIDKL